MNGEASTEHSFTASNEKVKTDLVAA